MKLGTQIKILLIIKKIVDEMENKNVVESIIKKYFWSINNAKAEAKYLMSLIPIRED